MPPRPCIYPGAALRDDYIGFSSLKELPIRFSVNLLIQLPSQADLWNSPTNVMKNIVPHF
jgi:hypothetical protein